MLFYSSLAIGFLGTSENMLLRSYCEYGNWKAASKLITKRIKQEKNFNEETYEYCIVKAFNANHEKMLNLLFTVRPTQENIIVSHAQIIKAIKSSHDQALTFAAQNGLTFENANKDQYLRTVIVAANPYVMMETLLLTGQFSSENLNIFYDVKNTFYRLLGYFLSSQQKNVARLLLSNGADHLDFIFLFSAEGEAIGILDNQLDFWIEYNEPKNLRILWNKIVHKKMKVEFLDYFSKTNKKEFLDEVNNLRREFNLTELKAMKNSFYKNKPKDNKIHKVYEKICIDICDGQNNENYVLTRCGHNLCKDCLASQIASTYFTCPIRDCETYIHPCDLALFGIDKKACDDIEIRDLRDEFMNISFFIPCKQPDCPGGSYSIRNYENGTAHSECSVCMKETCLKCSDSHPKTYCKETNYQLNEQFIASKYKKCPRCEARIDKYDGCNIITCRCGLRFNLANAHY